MKLPALLPALLLPLVASAQAYKVDFEPQTYTWGQRLWGQGDLLAKWSGNSTDLFEVAPSVGVNGSAGLLVNSRGLDYQNAILEISPRALGIKTDADQAVVSYSFAFKPEELVGDAVLARIRLAGGAIQFEFYSTGNIFTFDGSAPAGQRHRNLRDVHNSRNVLTPGKFVTLSGVINYPAKTFTVLLDGVPQNAGAPLGFITDDARLPDAGQVIRFEVSPHVQTKPDWRPFVIDDIVFAPATPAAPSR